MIAPAASLVPATLALLVLASPARAEQPRRFQIPPGRLSDALIALAEQAGLSLAIRDPLMARRSTRGFSARLTPSAALSRLLAGSGLAYRFVDARTVTIVRQAVPKRLATPVSPRPWPRRAPPRQPPAPPKPPVPPPPAAAAEPLQEIIVTGSKQRTPLADYPASIAVVSLNDTPGARRAAAGSEEIVARIPVLSSTALGPGRNKLFIRGIADSGFNGPSQATVGQYLGDVRLVYNAPDPNLALYDLRQAEVLEGPQGTLYGAGAIGGILRLVPAPPDADDFSASLIGGANAVRHGAAGYDAAAVVNLPLAADTSALRGVVYDSSDPGYIDDPARGRADINGTRTTGGRLAFQILARNEWTINLGALAQYITSRDGQYVEKELPHLQRRSVLAQPFDNDYVLGYADIVKRWGAFELVSATGWARHDIGSSFDATRSFDATQAGGEPTLFREDREISLVSHETRLSRRGSSRTFVAGISVVSNIDKTRRQLGPPTSLTPITGVRNTILDAALFGEASFPLVDDVSATLGGRLVHARITGEPLDETASNDAEYRRASTSFVPTLALSWKPGRDLLLFARYQRGFRAGGLAVAGLSSSDPVVRFEEDSIGTLEAGVRYGQAGRDRLAVAASLSYTGWADIQADLVDAKGLPFTANIGDGHILGLEASMSWRPYRNVRFDVAFFASESALKDPAAGFEVADETSLPNVSPFVGRATATYDIALGRDITLALNGSIRFVGRSRLGLVPLDFVQGGYAEASVGSRLDLGAYGVSFDITNIGDVEGNRFAFGNPFSVLDRNQITPLRPRTIRIGFDAAF